jgi:hypothetical protein
VAPRPLLCGEVVNTPPPPCELGGPWALPSFFVFQEGLPSFPLSSYRAEQRGGILCSSSPACQLPLIESQMESSLPLWTVAATQRRRPASCHTILTRALRLPPTQSNILLSLPHANWKERAPPFLLTRSIPLHSMFPFDPVQGHLQKRVCVCVCACVVFH